MSKVTLKRTGVVAEFKGTFWGIVYEDGHGREMGFGPIHDASVSDPQYCKSPTDLTYPGSPQVKFLEKARLVPITITTIYEVEDGREENAK